MISRNRVRALLEARRHRPEPKEGAVDEELTTGLVTAKAEVVGVGEANNLLKFERLFSV